MVLGHGRGAQLWLGQHGHRALCLGHWWRGTAAARYPCDPLSKGVNAGKGSAA